MLSSNGELSAPIRCKATNLCAYCAGIFARETAEMLVLDALEDAPTMLCVLTAREFLTRRDTYRHLEQIRRAARYRWPGFRYCVTIEFQRRGAMHLNLLVKGVPPEMSHHLYDAIVGVWCARVDALPEGQYVGPISDHQGAVVYVSNHFLKPSQAPPIGWKGHRVSYTRDYLVRPASVMRPEARRSRRVKWAISRAITAGLPADEIDALAASEAARSDQSDWRLYYLPFTTKCAPEDRDAPYRPDAWRLAMHTASEGS